MLSMIFKRRICSSVVARNVAAVQSSCVEGTVLNLKIKKNGQEPVALADSEYPSWLWDCLDAQKMDDQLKTEDVLRWRKKQLKTQNTKRIKNNNFLSTMG
ncbi:Mitochondrial ribosomal protein L54 [Scheffersomyces spartinae]|uniref:Large ribosomal subunit protein mL54 n=1 Tax=Scheffersomyces spartinae TaxID=45513 RepID=A0A9P7V6I7_9ASCO|nr:Mitochondrial ribosomal protein L54 [Scheffersomyces spartinae]KAG7192047.1 Mitochondrial ribosomal protein L54 [Scheffersomyces spartinae]